MEAVLQETTKVRNQQNSSKSILGGAVNLFYIQWPKRTIVDNSYPQHVNKQIINLTDDLSLIF